MVHSCRNKYLEFLAHSSIIDLLGQNSFFNAPWNLKHLFARFLISMLHIGSHVVEPLTQATLHTYKVGAWPTVQMADKTDWAAGSNFYCN